VHGTRPPWCTGRSWQNRPGRHATALPHVHPTTPATLYRRRLQYPTAHVTTQHASQYPDSPNALSPGVSTLRRRPAGSGGAPGQLQPIHLYGTYAVAFHKETASGHFSGASGSGSGHNSQTTSAISEQGSGSRLLVKKTRFYTSGSRYVCVSGSCFLFKRLPE